VQVFLDRAGVQYDANGVVRGSRGILPVPWTGMQDVQRNETRTAFRREQAK